jgi:MFS family permease
MASETTPLLHTPDVNDFDERAAPINTPATGPPTSKRAEFHDAFRRHWKVWKPIYLCFLFLLFIEFYAESIQAPALRMVEIAVCRHYYEQHDPGKIDFGSGSGYSDELCGIEAVQRRVANMNAVLGTLEVVPGLVLAVPYGMLADAKGRKFVLGLCMLGIVCSSFWALATLSQRDRIPYWMIYTYPLFQLVGGGAVVLTNLIMAMIADAAPSEIR